MGSRSDPSVLPLPQDVWAEVDRILGSPEFRQSEQSKRLLRYLVERSLEGAQDALRERAIGVAIFGQETGYDTNENPIVRVRANEIRKRLAKYYQHADPGAFRLEIPAGAYRVEFRGEPALPLAIPEAPPTPVAASPEAPRRYPTRLVAAVAAVAIVAIAIWLLVSRSTPAADALTLFWKPALQDSSPVIICTGHPVVYRYSRDFAARIRGREGDHFENQTGTLKVAPDQVLYGRDIVAIPDQYTGLGSALAIARIHGWLARHGKDSDIRFGNDLSFTDLRKAPAVLIGAFSNRWTVEFTRSLRLVFEPSERAPGVRDTQAGKVWSLPQLQENGRTNEDYVLISRVLHSTSGEFVVAAAGITQYGGHTVGEVLSQPTLLNEAVRRAGPGWEKRNLQLLYHVQVIGETTGPPELVAVYSW